ncbi:MAG: alkaline phosphatase family protein [Promethearchaeia archaeon]
MKKLIILCFDGLSWNIINKLNKAGITNNIERLMELGSYGSMKADFPLISPRIWTSIHTGYKANKHGILDFYFTPRDIKKPSMWDYLHKEGFRVGVYRPLIIPKTIKNTPFFIPGFLSPQINASPQKYQFIKDLDEQLRADSKGLSVLITLFKTFLNLFKSNFSLSKLLKILLFTVKYISSRHKKSSLFYLKEIEFLIHSSFYLNLIKRHRPEFSIFYENSCDSISHQFWNEWRDKTDLSFAIPRIYSEIDKYIGKVYEFAMKNGYSLLILSDHGFSVNKDLKKHGYLRTIKITGLLSALDLEDHLFGIQLDNFAYFRKKPTSQKSSEFFRDMFEAVKFKDKQFFSVEKYKGNFIITVNIEVVPLLKPEGIIKISDKEEVTVEEIIEFNSNRFGAHSSKNGVFMLCGENIRNKKIKEVKPYDILPTLFAHLGVPIPKQLDGKVVKNIFSKKPKPQYYDYTEDAEEGIEGKTKREKETIKKHLKSLEI